MDDLYENLKAIAASVIKLTNTADEPSDNLYDNIKLIYKNLQILVANQSSDSAEDKGGIELHPALNNFPIVGKPDKIYIDTSTNISYRFDSGSSNYISIKSDFSEIKIINGNGGI